MAMDQPGYVLRVLLKYAVAPAVAAAIGAYKLRRIRRRVAADAGVLAAWAKKRGWVIADPNDPRVIEELGRLTGLLAEEGERGVGTVIIGQNATGKVVIAETYRSDPAQQNSDESGPSVDISFASTTAGPVTLCRVTQGGWLVRSKVVPFLDGAAPTSAQAAVVQKLPSGTRLRVLSDRILLRRPGFLTPDEADALLDRLGRLSSAGASGGPHR
ncbi:MAG: hypothetical protein JWM53_4717 [bacterium]|nr:hypothetical protein [bacterium]